MATSDRGKKAAKTKKKRKGSKKKIKSLNTTTTTTTTPLHLPSSSHEHISELIPNLISAASDAHSFLLTQDLHLFPSQSLSLEYLLSSTALSLTKLVSLISLPPPHSFDPPPPPPPPSSIPPNCWFHRFLSSAVKDNNARWAESFNISESSFDLLLRLLAPHLCCLSPIPPNYALAATLFRLAHSASYSALARRFNFDSTTACRVFYTVCKAITENLCHLFGFKSDIDRTIVGFGWISLPNCCGVLGYDKFEFNSQLLGENGALIVQALVDSEGRFLDVSAGWQSILKPEDILGKSKLFVGVEDSHEYLNGPSFELNDGNSIPQYILGEGCLPLLPWLLTAYRKSDDDLNEAQLAFNSAYDRGIEMVRMAFRRLRKRWKLVSKVQCVEAFPSVIVTCCLLHNFLIKCSEEDEEEAIIDEKKECLKNEVFPVFNGEKKVDDENAKAIRDAVASHLVRIIQRSRD